MKATTVIFRKYPDGTVIGIYPDITLPNDDDATQTLYALAWGKRSITNLSDSYETLMAQTKQARADEYNDLFQRLLRIHTSLRVMRRRKPQKKETT